MTAVTTETSAATSAETTGAPTPTAATTATAAYVDAVAQALVRAGVPQAERQDMLDDLVGHLAELEAEDDDALEAQLGPPPAYAAELLASAGIAVEAGGAATARAWWRRLLDGTRAEVGGPRVRAVRAFLPELRSGWLVLRAWAWLALAAVWGASDGRVFPLPDAFGNDAVSFLGLAGAVAGSVWLGRRRGWRDRVATAVGVLGLLVAVIDGSPRVEYRYDTYGTTTGLLMTPDGRPVTNIWPFDAEGQPLEDVLLFDQDGQPISLGEVSTMGLVIPGLFPQATTVWEYDETTGTEREVPMPRPSISIPRLPGTPPPDDAATTTSTTTSTTTPPPDPGVTTTVAAAG